MGAVLDGESSSPWPAGSALPVPRDAAEPPVLPVPRADAAPPASRRGTVVVSGKRFSLDGRDFPVRGVTYGSFLPRGDGQPFPEPATVRDDFAAMRDRGLTVARTYAVPPSDVIDAAEEAGVRLLVGLDYEDWRMLPVVSRASRRVRDAGRLAADGALALCAGRPDAVLGVVVGNEVPGDLVRLYGVEPVQDVLSDLVRHIHHGSPELLVTYANYPTTGYLDVRGADFLSCNVFLERPGDLRRYIAQLHVIADDRPVVITELGLAAAVHGEDGQALSVSRQLDEVDAAGAAGACVFAWTDEWGVGGEAVEGWGFGLTSEERRPKPALDAVESWARRGLRDLRSAWPTMSVIVCAYNEERYLGDCLDSLAAVEYPGLEVIVCDDGSTDRTPQIASRYPFRLLTLPHGGLSAARNAGLAAATGEIVAYLDADAMCDPQWPYHLALSMEDGVAATGGPNFPVPGSGFQERVVAHSPGGPIQVLLTDDRAEHVAGCNCAFRRDVLSGIGGFDTAYTSAGDDVDVCWRLQDDGHAIGFAHAAQVWHHRRDSVRRYLRQQRGYGASERMVSGRHASRFNRLGQARWSGFLYASPRMRWPVLRPVLYHGPMGFAPYQRVHARPADVAVEFGAALLPLAVPLGLAGAVLAVASPWFLLAPGLVIALAVAYAVLAAVAITPPRDEPRPLALRCLAGLLHALQPIVRTWGRLRGRPLPPLPSDPVPWSGDRAAWLAALQTRLCRGWASVVPGGPLEPWDLSVATGPWLVLRIRTAVAWQWQPTWRLTVRPRPALPLALAVASALCAVDVRWVAVLAGVLVWTGVEAVWLLRSVRRALRDTTSGSCLA